MSVKRQYQSGKLCVELLCSGRHSSSLWLGVPRSLREQTQQVTINTPGAEGAQCTLKSDGIGTKVVTTPAALVLDKSQHAIAVTCKKPCFQDGIGIIASNTETMTAGNLLLGGVVGLGVDAASGAMNKYNADNQIAMTPIRAAAARYGAFKVASGEASVTDGLLGSASRRLAFTT